MTTDEKRAQRNATMRAKRIEEIRHNFKHRNFHGWSGPKRTNPSRSVIRSAIKIVRLLDRYP